MSPKEEIEERADSFGGGFDDLWPTGEKCKATSYEQQGQYVSRGMLKRRGRTFSSRRDNLASSSFLISVFSFLGAKNSLLLSILTPCG